MCRCLSRHWSLTFCTLNPIKFCTHQWMCTSSYTHAFPFFFVSFVGVFVLIFVCTAAEVWWEYNLQSTASMSWGSTADMESLATDRKTVWNMHATEASLRLGPITYLLGSPSNNNKQTNCLPSPPPPSLSLSLSSFPSILGLSSLLLIMVHKNRNDQQRVKKWNEKSWPGYDRKVREKNFEKWKTENLT